MAVRKLYFSGNRPPLGRGRATFKLTDQQGRTVHRGMGALWGAPQLGCVLMLFTLYLFHQWK